jgi:cytochrome c-type biogenesis protein CcmH/NrfG
MISRIIVYLIVAAMLIISATSCATAPQYGSTRTKQQTCKYKIAQKKKEIKAKQSVKVVPYYARTASKRK